MYKRRSGHVLTFRSFSGFTMGFIDVPQFRHERIARTSHRIAGDGELDIHGPSPI
ncbi:hypothetical protein [Paraburkholderia humisilvae]|uniref:Uncharacterized protein n=1 Tax=Paraburkholderia humisilvae TaxID=627669 RepID=A0A6J5F1U1_9BURK|nr:hypothetical protein [Paraburkholderia humisilvae]CAB3772810.1 hypothetical protein LMG29542_06989 [Paraburkholderia humisilvae]